MIRKTTLLALALGVGVACLAAAEAEAAGLSAKLGVGKTSAGATARVNTTRPGTGPEEDADRQQLFDTLVVGNFRGSQNFPFPSVETTVQVKDLKHFRLVVVVFRPVVSPRAL
jgi:hypothetical protein